MPLADTSEPSDFLSRPIILIGCGRSGSTLLRRVLSAHPDVQFLGETDFLIARLWREVWDNRFWLHAEYNRRRQLTSSREPPVEIPAAALDAARERAARSVRMLFGEILELDPAFAAWGFKEIWNGNDAVAQVPWSVYHAVFPGARWIHLVRDPFAFARSSAQWNQRSLTIELLAEELRHWQQVVAWSQRLQGREGYFPIRFEDLVAAPEACLTPILASAGVAWHEDCTRELRRRTMASKGSSITAVRTIQQARIEDLIDNTNGLARLMKEFGYTVPHELDIEESMPAQGSSAPIGKTLRKAVKRYLKSDRRLVRRRKA